MITSLNGFPIRYCTFAEPKPDEVESEHFSAANLHPLGLSRDWVRLLKPNGSLNWLVSIHEPYRTSAMGLQFDEDSILVIPLTRTGLLRYWCSKAIFQRVNLPTDSSKLPPDVLQCILPPTSAKRAEATFLREIRRQEESAIGSADEVYIIGWSMPKSDRDQRELIEASVKARRKPIDRLTVVNQGGAPNYFGDVASCFGVEKSELHIFNSGFIDFAEGL